MFKCSSCKQSVGPKVKPVLVVVGTRNRDYTNIITILDEYEREQKKVINSSGTEITATVLQCPPCAKGMEPEPVVVPEAIRKILAKNKPFEEPLPTPLRPKLIALAVHNALGRTEHKSRRAKVECEGTIPTIKYFVERNPNYIF